MTTITPCLWIQHDLEEAIAFYRTVFNTVEISETIRSGASGPASEGKLIAASFSLDGNKFDALNGGPAPFTEAVSFVIRCKDQQEVDHFWYALTANGGEESMCGWLKDPFGLSWQITPEIVYRLYNGQDRQGADRAMQAMMSMRRLIIADLEAAYAGI